MGMKNKFRDFMAITLLLAFAQLSNCEEENHADRFREFEEFAGLVEAGMAKNLGTDQYHFSLAYNDTVEFGKDVLNLSEVRVRCYYSRPKKEFIWATEQRRNKELVRDIRGDVHWTATVIKDKRLYKTTSTGMEEFQSDHSFDEIVEASCRIHPKLWGLVRFPQSADTRNWLIEMKTLALMPGNSVTVTESKELVSAKLLANYELNDTPVLDIVNWQFRLPDYAPVRLLRTQRVLNVESEVEDQSIVWKRVDGVERPVMMLSSFITFREPTEGKVLEIGKGVGDCSIKWFDTYPGSVNLLETVADIHKFLAEGETMAKGQL